jgi:tetratricopeptide (TPR) repeat protein
LAWTLVTCPNQALKDPSKALELAQQACALTQLKHPVYLNTLAACYAGINNLPEAIKILEKAIILAQKDPKLSAKLQKQLDLFKRALAESPGKTTQ